MGVGALLLLVGSGRRYFDAIGLGERLLLQIIISMQSKTKARLLKEGKKVKSTLD